MPTSPPGAETRSPSNLRGPALESDATIGAALSLTPWLLDLAFTEYYDNHLNNHILPLQAASHAISTISNTVSFELHEYEMIEQDQVWVKETKPEMPEVDVWAWGAIESVRDARSIGGYVIKIGGTQSDRNDTGGQCAKTGGAGGLAGDGHSRGGKGVISETKGRRRTKSKARTKKEIGLPGRKGGRAPNPPFR